MCAHVYTCICMSVLFYKYVGAPIFLKHKGNIRSQPQRDLLPDLASKQMIRCRRTRQESSVRAELKDRGQKAAYQKWGKGPKPG